MRKTKAPLVYPASIAARHLQLAAVTEQSFIELGRLYDYIAGLPEAADVRVILKAPTDAGKFYRQYRHIVLPRGQLGWVKP